MSIKDITLEISSIDDVDEIHRLMTRVYNLIESKEMFVCSSRNHVIKCIRDKGFGIKALNENGEIVGSFLVIYPEFASDNLGLDIGLSENELLRVAHMESSVVAPEYRGVGLHSRMLCYAESLIDKSKIHYLLSTVHPNNISSYTAFEHNGYKLLMTKEKYGGLLRRIYLKEV